MLSNKFISLFETKEQQEIADNFYYIKELESCFSDKSIDRLKESVLINEKTLKQIEKDLLASTKPKEGDWIEYDGNYARLSCIHQCNGRIQLSNKIGVYVSRGGFSTASGCTWDSDIEIDSTRLKLTNLMLTDDTKEAKCWIFSEENAGANRAIYSHINFKVWHLM